MRPGLAAELKEIENIHNIYSSKIKASEDRIADLTALSETESYKMLEKNGFVSHSEDANQDSLIFLYRSVDLEQKLILMFQQKLLSLQPRIKQLRDIDYASQSR